MPDPMLCATSEDLAAVIKVLKEEFPEDAAEILKSIVKISY